VPALVRPLAPPSVGRALQRAGRDARGSAHEGPPTRGRFVRAI